MFFCTLAGDREYQVDLDSIPDSLLGIPLMISGDAVAGGENHSLGLKSDGTILSWGSNNHSECSVPAPNADFVAVAAGGSCSLGL